MTTARIEPVLTRRAAAPAIPAIRPPNRTEAVTATLASQRRTARALNEKTGLTWLWALLFGPFWFLFNGYFGFFLLICVMGLASVAFPPLLVLCWLAPIPLAYHAHRRRAERRANRLVGIDE